MTSASLKWPVRIIRRDAGAMRYVVVFAWCAIVLGILLRLSQLPTRTLYVDEGYTQIRVAGHTAADMMQTLYTGRPITPAVLRRDGEVDAHSSPARLVASLMKEDAQHPPLFYLAELAIVKLFGNALIVWRILPAVFGILSIAAAYALARELFRDGQAGLLAAAVFAVSPIERIYSDQAREYSLFTLLVLVATLAIVRAVREPSVPNWLVYALVSAAGLYADPIMAYVLAAHALFVVAAPARSRRSIVSAFAAACTGAVAVYTPWLYELAIHRADITQTNVWSAARWPLTRLAAKWLFNTGSTFFDLEYIDLRWAVVFAAVAIVALAAIVRGFRSADSAARWCLGAAIVVPAILLAAPDILLGHHRSSVARYGLSVYAMLAIVAARGLVRRPAATAFILAAGLCSGALGSMHPTWWDNDADADDAHIAALLNSVPHAQVVSTISPPEFFPFARFLNDDVRISLSPDLAAVRFAAQDPLFVLRPSPADLRALEGRTGRTFAPVPYARTRTAHDIGTSIANKDASSSETTDLYRADETAPR